MIKRLLIPLIIVLLLVGCAISGMGRNRVLDVQEGTIPAEGISRISVDVEAGSLRVIGQAEQNSVRYEAEFVGDVREKDVDRMLQNLEFTHHIEGDRLTIVTYTRTRGWNRHGGINLTLHVPSAADLDIKDSSGSMRVSDMAGSVTIDDSSGSITVENVGRNLRVDDSSGSITVREVGGSADIEDSSGGITVEGVTENVVISDSSGGISVYDVGGDFEVTRDGSGGIRYGRIEGRVNIPEKKRRGRRW